MLVQLQRSANAIERLQRSVYMPLIRFAYEKKTINGIYTIDLLHIRRKLVHAFYAAEETREKRVSLIIFVCQLPAAFKWHVSQISVYIKLWLM